MSSDWVEDLKEEERKNQEMEDQKDNEGKKPQTGPKFSSVTTFTPQLPISSMKQLGKRSSMTPEKEDKKCDTLMTLLGHKGKETLEDID